MSSNYFKSKLEITFKFYYLGFAGIIFGFVLLYHGIIYFALPLVLSGIFLLLSPKIIVVKTGCFLVSIEKHFTEKLKNRKIKAMNKMSVF